MDHCDWKLPISISNSTYPSSNSICPNSKFRCLSWKLNAGNFSPSSGENQRKIFGLEKSTVITYRKKWQIFRFKIKCKLEKCSVYKIKEKVGKIPNATQRPFYFSNPSKMSHRKHLKFQSSDFWNIKNQEKFFYHTNVFYF